MAYIGNSLAQGLVSGANIQDGTVDTPDLKASAVTAAKIADGAVAPVKLDLSTGIANAVAYLNAAKELTTNAGFVFDGTKLGVGTITPTAKITIASASPIVASRGTAYLYSTDAMGINLGGQLSLGGSYSGTTETIFAAVAGRKENNTGADISGYLQFSTTNATLGVVERMRIDSKGNLGLGVTPSAWDFPTLQIEYGSLNAHDYTGNNHQVILGNNYKLVGGEQQYMAASMSATTYTQTNGQHFWKTAPAGTVGTAIPFVSSMTLNAESNLGIGSAPESGSRLKLYNSAANVKMTLETTNAYSAFTNYSGASNEFSIGFVPSDGSFRFCNYGDLTGGERLRITSTGGVQFKTNGGVPAMIDTAGNSMARFGTFAVASQGYTDFSPWREEYNNGVVTTTFYIYFGPGPADSRSYWYVSIGTGVSTWMDIFKVDMFDGNWSYGQIVGWKEQTVSAVANTWTVNTLLSLDKVNFGGVNMFATPVGTSYVKFGGSNTGSANSIKYIITSNRSWITQGMTLNFSATSPF